MFNKYINKAKKFAIEMLHGTKTIQSRLENLERMLELFRNEYKFSPRNVFMINENIGITKIETGQKLFIDRNDLSLAPHLVLDGRWEPSVAKWLMENYDTASTFLDVGANFGYFSIYLASVTDNTRGGKVIAIEPNPHMSDLIRKSVSINGFDNRVKIVACAVGDEKCELPLYESKDGLLGSTTLRKTNSYIRQTKLVEVDTLDSIIANEKIENIGLIKMDIEGFEEKAFKGMAKLIANNKSLKILLEFSPLLYEKPIIFFTKILDSFTYIAVLDEDGKEIPIDRYEQIVEYSRLGHCDIVMYNKS
ncbi:MAG: FkbM family methyltransferase [Patescibacteria group bacterium]